VFRMKLGLLNRDKEIMSFSLKQWHGLLDDRSAVEADIRVEAILAPQSPSRGGSLPFQALASDENIYWVKMPLSQQGPQMLATEQIVSACGRHIGAPVCETALIEIPEVFDGDVLGNGTVLHAGIAHASRSVENSIFDKWHTPRHRNQDDNRKRHAGYFALYDWCWGNDMQWLYDLKDDRKTYSHDHGHFLPGGPTWTAESLKENVDSPREIDPLTTGLDDKELIRIADKLDQTGQAELLPILQKIPAAWTVPPTDLAAVGWFLEKRSSGVAMRLRTLADRNISKE